MVFSLGGNLVGFDVNPVVDLLRIVTGAGSNLRVNPSDGTLTTVDTPLFYDNTTADGDPIDVNAGANPTIAGIAHSNNVANAVATTVFGLDAGLDILVTLDPPNNVADAALGVGGPYSLYQIDLTTGAATLVGTIGRRRPPRYTAPS